MKKILKQIVELWIKQRRLKKINKEVEIYCKLNRCMEVQKHLIGNLIKEYEKIYGECLGMRNLK